MSWPEPRTGTTDPAYYRDAADSVEAQLRADFTRYYQLRLFVPFAETPVQKQEFTAQADGLAARWGRHESPEHRRLWEQLQAAVSGWELRPEATRAAYNRIAQAKADGDLGVDAVVWRNLRQAAEVTGHIETTITGSAQDAARWRPPDRAVGPEADRSSLLDRALGGRGPELASVAEVDAIIAETDRLLAAEHERGDRDTGADEHADLLPERVRSAPVAYTYSAEADHEARQIAALRQLQDVTAEHARLADQWDGSPEQDQAQLVRLESLLDAARAARIDAAEAGVPAAGIENVYRTGRDGAYWHEQPGDLRLGRIARLVEERDRAAAEADTLREVVEDLRRSGPAPTSQAGQAPSSASRDPAEPEPSPDQRGADIGEAIATAMPEAESVAWSPTDGIEDNLAAAPREIGVDADVSL
ncbi:hypothetical protein OHB12_12115 [Nocardia sp. NBC_01730]|uniref:hypothetical protein n=1 Tax=Nocardia sp. NBC_01730 TaxID=2975998 RepID=UPI002E137D86|nr:hypothetical protein OHB12_12115 [Nocardia sp. NBC_01730]